MADKEEKKQEQVSIEDLQKQISSINEEVKSLKEENTKLKEDNAQKDLEITKLTLGGTTKVVTKEVKEDEEIEFDFDF